LSSWQIFNEFLGTFFVALYYERKKPANDHQQNKVTFALPSSPVKTRLSGNYNNLSVKNTSIVYSTDISTHVSYVGSMIKLSIDRCMVLTKQKSISCWAKTLVALGVSRMDNYNSTGRGSYFHFIISIDTRAEKLTTINVTGKT
jgi:hypothetical protein